MPLAVPKKEPRKLGILEGKLKVPNNFDDPLPDDALDLFYNGPLFPPESAPPVEER
jgi:hypothetical protein